MRETTAIPELEPRKPQPELKVPRKPRPDVTIRPTSAKPEVGDDQGDSGPDKDNPITNATTRRAPMDPQDAHIGATEEQVSKTSAPSGDAFEDEPKQG